jgi:hypothetical protein
MTANDPEPQPQPLSYDSISGLYAYRDRIIHAAIEAELIYLRAWQSWAQRQLASANKVPLTTSEPPATDSG